MRTIVTLTLCGLLAACGGEGDPDAAGGPSAEGASSAPAAPAWLLAAEPEGAVGVRDARGLEAGQDVTIVGRLRDFEPGFGALTLTDDRVPYCGAEDCTMEDGCLTPWDYCCRPQEANDASLPVELHGADGEVVETSDLGLRLLDLVVVRGTLQKAESGGLVLVTREGWYRRERPELPATLRWEQH